MGGTNLRPARVYQTATLLLESRALSHPPPWYTTIGSIPPSEIITRPLPVQLREPYTRRRVKKASKLFKPQPIQYEEDKLRSDFFGDHPWELARPRIVLEDDGKDGQRWDWSNIQQRGRPLSGESVIQRQLWLMNNVSGMSRDQAYDKARKEFYALRQEEEVERRVAREEALSTGAYFGKGVLEVGMELEDQAYEDWKAWATKEVETIERQRDSAYTSFTAPEEDSPAVDEDVDAIEETPVT